MKQLIAICSLGLAINSMAADFGRYKNASGEEFFLSKDGTILVTLVRQVGGTGGISEKKPLVPYPTVCKFNELGKVTDDRTGSLIYQVSYLQLIHPASQQEAERCTAWIAAMNAYAETHELEYWLPKKDFSKAR